MASSTPPKRPNPLPPPPSVGSPRKKIGDASKPKAGKAADGDVSGPAVDPAQGDSKTRPWTRVDEKIEHDDGPDDSDAPAATPPRRGPPPPPPPRATPPTIEAGESSSGIRAPVLSGDVAASTSANRPIAIDWDFDAEEKPTIAVKPNSPIAKSTAAAAAKADQILKERAKATSDAATASTAAAASPQEPTADAPAVDDESTAAAEVAEPEPEPEPEPAKPPTLPVPGMLRDGASRKAADFRATPRASATTDPPRGGMVPPKPSPDTDDSPRLRPGDTAAFIAVAANELLEELAAESPAEASTQAAVVPATSDAESPQPVATPTASDDAATPPPPTDEDRDRRFLYWGLPVLLLLLGLLIWLAMRTPEPSEAPPTQTAAATTPPAKLDLGTAEPVAAASGASTDDGLEAIVIDDESTGGTGGTTGTSGGSDTSTGGESSSSSDGTAGSGSSTGGDDEADPTADSEDDGGRGSAKSTGRRPSTSKPKPKPSPSSSKPAASSKPAPKTDDAAELLKKARAAYRLGNGSAAYRFASQSRKLKKTGESAELMTLASCQMKRTEQARNSLRAVALLRRGAIRSTCRTKHGVRLGI